MTADEARLLRTRIAAAWPEATELEVEGTPGGAVVTMRIDGGLQLLSVTPDGPLVRYLLLRSMGTEHTGRMPGDSI